MSNTYNLNSSDVNLGSKSKIGCHFSNGFKKNKNNKTFTNKDKDGIKLGILIILIIVSIIYKKYKISVLIALLTSNFICKDVVRPIYLSSYIISIFVSNPPYLNIEKYFPQYIDFEKPSNFRRIKKEVTEYILKNSNAFFDTKDTFDAKTNYYIGGGDKVTGKKWKLSSIFVGNNFSKLAEQKLPFLVSLLKKNKNIVSCAISILPAKKAIPIHVGYYKGILRYQIAIKVPKDRNNVFICVNGEKYSWTEGKGVLFDDIYPHKVYNNSNEERIVLYMDVKRKLNNVFLDKLNNFTINMLTNSNLARAEIKKTEYQVEI